MSQANRLLRLKQVVLKVGLSRSQIYKLIAKGSFPEQIKIGPKISAWPEQTCPEAYDFIAHACAYLPIWETCSSCGKDVSYNYMIFRTELLDEFVKAVIPEVHEQWTQVFSESGGEA